ncbi:MAG: hypothetical protein J2P46_19900, partial [Zavarzinella sp.]|nr:hypothetical protein [Zavarzinella sp.]
LRYDKIGDKPFTFVSGGDLVDHFDAASPVPIQMSGRDLCNQLLHHYLLCTSSEVQGRFTTIAVFSDYKRHICLYEFKIADLIDFFSAFADRDAGNYGGSRLVWNEQKLDYDSIPLTE